MLKSFFSNTLLFDNSVIALIFSLLDSLKFTEWHNRDGYYYILECFPGAISTEADYFL